MDRLHQGAPPVPPPIYLYTGNAWIHYHLLTIVHEIGETKYEIMTLSFGHFCPLLSCSSSSLLPLLTPEGTLQLNIISNTCMNCMLTMLTKFERREKQKKTKLHNCRHRFMMMPQVQCWSASRREVFKDRVVVGGGVLVTTRSRKLAARMLDPKLNQSESENSNGNTSLTFADVRQRQWWKNISRRRFSSAHSADCSEFGNENQYHTWPN